ncbi:Hypothetical predicted protein [Paramuricea clavata]|uniref:Uncharacterized protein n=1 Tax=Paramuricea clavata TaxID=317549 RepID=A0A6S7FXB4_PARCT|nr:Hypothetical predicted protein [Paramuricea clavata]
MAEITPDLCLNFVNIGTNISAPLMTNEASWCGNCRDFSENNLRSHIIKGVKPGWWKGENKICFNLLFKIFEISSCIEGNQGEMVIKGLLTLDKHITPPKYISNLKRKVTRVIGKGPDGSCTIVSDLYVKSDIAKGIGEECDKFAITAEMLNNLLEVNVHEAKRECSLLSTFDTSVIITNKLVIELNDYREKINQPWSTLLSWLLSIGDATENVDLKVFHSGVERVIERKRYLMRNQGKNVCEEFLNQMFKFPQIHVQSSPANEYQKSLDEQVKYIEVLLQNIEKSNSEIELLNRTVSEQSLVSGSKSREIDNLKLNLSEMLTKQEEKSRELQQAMEKLNKMTPRNINKKIKRRDEMNRKLKEMSQQQQEEIEKKESELKAQEEQYEEMIDEKNEIIICLNEKLDSALEAKSKAQKLKSYYKVRNRSFQGKDVNGHLFSKITELKSKIAELENDLEVLQEKLEDFFAK